MIKRLIRAISFLLSFALILTGVGTITWILTRKNIGLTLLGFALNDDDLEKVNR